jgi:hypothetical protein
MCVGVSVSGGGGDACYVRTPQQKPNMCVLQEGVCMVAWGKGEGGSQVHFKVTCCQEEERVLNSMSV